MIDNVIEVRGLSRTYGKSVALHDFDLTVEQGIVLGLVGQNGAGKTTLIKHILGLLRAQQGSVRVFGMDPVADPDKVLAQIGYLSEEGDLPLWMRVDELMRYSESFYPTWDKAYAERLRHEFEIPLSSRLGAMSKGQRARVGLIAALAFRPALLLLDEPSAGLDPVVRRDILAAVIRTIADEGRTVLFSSHLLSEVEQVSDRVVMVRKGTKVFDDDLANIKMTHQRISVRFPHRVLEPPAIFGAFAWKGDDHEWSALYVGAGDELVRELAQIAPGAVVIEQGGASLDEIFVAHAEVAQ
jgi:ABC-2 type transport system ATP-binding protein